MTFCVIWHFPLQAGDDGDHFFLCNLYFYFVDDVGDFLSNQTLLLKNDEGGDFFSTAGALVVITV